MKQCKKLLSLLLVLAIIASMASMLSINAFAEAASWTITREASSWKYQTEKYVKVLASDDSTNLFGTTMFTETAKKDNQPADRYFELANKHAQDYVKPGSTYNVEFNMVVGDNNLSNVTLDFAYDYNLERKDYIKWLNGNPIHQVRFEGSTLSTIATKVGTTDPATAAGALFGTSERDIYKVSANVTVPDRENLINPDTIHLFMSLCNSAGAKVYAYNITITEILDTENIDRVVQVKDSDGASLNSIICKTGDSVSDYITDAEYAKYGYTYTYSPAVIAEDTTEIIVTYTALPGDTWESFTVDNSGTSYKFFNSDGIEKLSNTKYHFKSSLNSGKSPGDRTLLLANGLEHTESITPNLVYKVDFKLSTSASGFNIANVDIGFGQYAWGTGCGMSWTDFTRFQGNEVAAHATETQELDEDRTVYDMSFTVDAPASFDYTNPHMLLSICKQNGASGSFDAYVWDITVTKVGVINTYDVVDGDGNELGTLRGKVGQDVYPLIEASSYNLDGYTFTVSPTTIADDTETIVVTYTKKPIYQVVNDETDEVLGEISATEDDDLYAVIGNAGLIPDGYKLDSVDPECIDETTEEIRVTISELPVEIIDFGTTYGGNKDAKHYNDWKYLTAPADSKLEIVYDEENDNYKVQPKVHPTGGVQMTDKTQYNNRALLFANDVNANTLVAGKTYRLSFVLSLDTRYWSLSNIKAQLKFATNIWSLINDGAIDFDAGELSQYVVDTVTNGTTVDYTISFNVTVPVTGCHISMSLYGGAFYTLDNIEIWNTYEIPVVGQNGNSLGTACGRIGDRVTTVAADFLIEDGDYYYVPATETVTSITSPIVLNKSLKQNLAVKIDFGSSYPTSWKYVTVDTSKNGLDFVDGRVHSKMSSGKALTTSAKSWQDRAVLISESTSEMTLTAGETYRLKCDIQIDTSKSSLSQLRAGVYFGNYIYGKEYGTRVLYGEGQAISLNDCILNQVADGDLVTYTLGLEFTTSQDCNVMLTFYTDKNAAYNVEYWLDNVYIIKKTSAVVTNPRDNSIVATVSGYEGDEIGTVYSDNGLAKFVNVTAQYGWKDTPVAASSVDVIYRGDVNGDFAVNNADADALIDIILGNGGTYDEFGANANATALDDNTIDILDYISLKLKLENSDLAPDYLHYEDYGLVWNAEFDGKSIPKVFDSQWNSNRKTDGSIEYVGAGDAKTTKVENGILTYGSVYEDDHVITPDHITTKTTMNFTYGYFEVRAKLPFVNGHNPAFWFKSDGALAKTGVGVQEIDLMETLGSTKNVAVNVHYWNGDDHFQCDFNTSINRKFDVSALGTDEFHTYGMEWYKNNGVSYIDFYVDGNFICTLDASALNGTTPDLCNPVYFLIDSEVYAGVDSSNFPQNIEIDYVRLYQSRANEGTFIVTK